MRWEQMLMVFRLYVNREVAGTRGWIASSKTVAKAHGKSESYASRLRKWCRAYMKNYEDLPQNTYGTWNSSVLHSDEDLKQDIQFHLQGIGPFVSALDIVEFIGTDEMKTRLKLKKSISERTARRWMNMMQYRWQMEKKGQYSDGHERDDVVAYRQDVFLPAMKKHAGLMRKWDSDGKEDTTENHAAARRTVIWFHDESIFYAHDRRKLRWVHSSETPKPYAKGEGASLMVADFVSADYGWLRSPDGKLDARVLLKPGKNRDGYFTNDEVLEQVTAAMNILKEQYPNEDHVLVFDNAKTHSKRADDALSARRMPKGTSRPDANWGLKVNARDSNGKQIYTSDGKFKKIFKKMGDTSFNGHPQSLYFPDNHPTHPGLFKGMAVILEERGYANARGLRTQCPDFKCEKGAIDCCCRRLLFNQPDFVNVESLLETHCRERGFTALFLPKFHCELNFIEMCWGFAKRVYREYPPSSAIEDVERYALAALESIPLESMRR
jgi:hypothetical protein